jgi:predicted  nucleic acid-binding Zn-ribbon protein
MTTRSLRSQRAQDINSVKEEAQQRIQTVNIKFNGVYEVLELQLSETKQHHTEITPKMHDNNREAESKINEMQSEIVNLRQGLIVDSFCVLEENLEAKINELLNRRLGQFESKLDQLSGKPTAVYCIYGQPSVGSELNQVHDTRDSHFRSVPASVASVVPRLSHGFIAPRPLYTGPLCPTLE